MLKASILAAVLLAAVPAHADARHDFEDFCEQAIKAKLAVPASFAPDYFGSGKAAIMTFPDRTASWAWSVPFTASSRMGAVGHYTATCGQAPSGRVFASIR